jgi:hypothetical protein
VTILAEAAGHGGIGHAGAWLPILVGAAFVAAFAFHTLHPARQAAAAGT